jgi:hypothetical protein
VAGSGAARRERRGSGLGSPAAPTTTMGGADLVAATATTRTRTAVEASSDVDSDNEDGVAGGELGFRHFRDFYFFFRFLMWLIWIWLLILIRISGKKVRIVSDRIRVPTDTIATVFESVSEKNYPNSYPNPKISEKNPTEVNSEIIRTTFIPQCCRGPELSVLGFSSCCFGHLGGC